MNFSKEIVEDFLPSPSAPIQSKYRECSTLLFVRYKVGFYANYTSSF